MSTLLINAYSTVRDAPPLEFPHHLKAERDLTDPELKPHLDGFIGYVVQQLAGGQMTQPTYHVYRHIQRVRQHFSFNIEEADLDAMSDWAWKANAILFLPDGTVRDPSGDQLLPEVQGGTAELPYPPDARERKTRTEAELAEIGVTPLGTLPPVVAETEVVLRSSEDIARRCLALFIVALRAESIAAGNEIPLAEIQERMPLGVESLTPREREFLFAPGPSAQDITNFAWRYECLSLFFWILDMVEEITVPDQICDVPTIARLALDNNTPDFVTGARIRPVSDILDCLDAHFRLHWVIRQATHEQRDPPAGLVPGVVMERHHALNWLVQFEDKDWDDVDTPT